ncbi:MAG: DNA polymerase III subunit beta, partial [Patescibacteria group bacterium]|nr:DNA polymerase III subunit beta [Patescibacteria group bacterium]
CFKRDTNKEYSFILPQKTVREIINIFSEKEGKIRLYFSPNQVMFESLLSGLETSHPQIQLISRLIEGEYPDYQEIIPKKYETQIILPKDEFLNQIKSVSLFSQKTNEIKVKVNPNINGLELFSQNPEIGETKSLIKGKINGEPIEVSFNYKFLIDGLSQIKSSEIIFELTKNDGPAIIKPVGDLNYIYIIMPVKSI